MRVDVLTRSPHSDFLSTRRSARLSNLWDKGQGQSESLGRPNWERIEPWIFYGALLIMLLPLWTVQYFPSQDGPMHMYNAVVARDFDRPDRALFREFFRPNERFAPNWLCPHLLPVLVEFFSPRVAEKLLLSVYLILFPLSIRYCLRCINPRAGVLAIAALPFVPNQFFHMGFHDFCISLAGYFIAAGYFLRRRKDFSWISMCVLALILLAVYAIHLVSVLMVLPLLAAVACVDALRLPGDLRTRLRHLAPVVGAMLPVVIVAAYFVLQPHSVQPLDPWPKGWTHRFYFLISWMKGIGWLDLVPAGAVFLLFAVVSTRLFQRARRHNRRGLITAGAAGGLLLTTFAYCVVFLLAPDAAAGGQLLLFRLAAYPLFTLLLWWAAVPMSRDSFHRLAVAVARVSLPALAVMLTLDTINYRNLNSYLAEYEKVVSLVTPNSTLLPIHYDNYTALEPEPPHHRLAVGIDPFRHIAANGLAEKGVVDLADYWATTDHHLLQWQPGLDPMRVGLDRVDNFAAYSRRTGVRIDYVLVWSGGIQHDEPEGKIIASQLHDYELIYDSPHHGYLKLYRNQTPRLAMSE